MPRGLSIHVGLNGVDPNHYEGGDGVLAGSEHDARDLRTVADALHFESTLLLTRQASHAAVSHALAAAARTLGRGDILLLTYAGHGGERPDPAAEALDASSPTRALSHPPLVAAELYAPA